MDLGHREDLMSFVPKASKSKNKYMGLYQTKKILHSKSQNKQTKNLPTKHSVNQPN